MKIDNRRLFTYPVLAEERGDYETCEFNAEMKISLDAANNLEIDLNNCKILYANLRFLTPYQAADERFWAGLCHGAFYDYVRRRWGYANEIPSTSGDAVKYIKSRFFFGGGARDSLSTNTLAKCWWTGRALYDSTRRNSFEKLDILGANNFYTKAFSIMTRSFAANPKILNGIIKFIKHFNDRVLKSARTIICAPP